jgi:Flp pilus assembly protein TadG
MKILKLVRGKMKNGERGQAMLLIALAFVGLVAFIGLAIDAGILFAHIGHLRRGVDAAALSAANQIRQDVEIEQITGSAEQLILLNLPAGSAVGDLNVVVETCKTPGTSIEGCTVNGINRKLARVQASLDVSLAFLPIVGWNTVSLSADAISEAASIDLVLVIDNSTSMAYDADCNDGDDDDGDGSSTDCPADPYERWWPNNYGEENPVPCPNHLVTGDPYSVCYGESGEEVDLPDNYLRYPTVCNVFNECHPFKEVRESAKTLVNSMYEGYDQIAIVTFNKFAGKYTGTQGENDELPTHEADLNLTTSKAAALTALNDMTVYPNIIAGSVCSGWAGEGDPRACMRTNTAAGLMLASKTLDVAINPNAREEAVKVVVLLSDGLANAAYDMGSSPWPAPASIELNDWICDEAWRREPSPDADPPGDGRTRIADDFVAPFCTDGNPYTGYDGVYNISINGDTDNMARRYADYLGCLPADEAGENVCAAGGGLGAVIFTIGLGDGLTSYSSPKGEVPVADVGEKLLRYIARVGFNGVPKFTPNSPCWVGDPETGGDAPVGTSCGNYYYAKDTADLGVIFEEIADRIFTRLTH